MTHLIHTGIIKEEAAELFSAAGKKWKLDGPDGKWSRDYRKAANSLEKAAKCYVDTDNPHGQVMVSHQ